MELFNILAACATLSIAADSPIEQFYPVRQAECVEASQIYKERLQSIELSAADRDAISRVTFAEAGNQGDSGLAGVIYTIINRLISGNFGETIEEVVNARGQFEPVQRAGGDWKNLPSLTEENRTRIDTIINLALDGHLPDVTNGALFFQNPKIVAQREEQGSVSKGLTNFGGATPSAVIHDHAFYSQIKKGQPVTLRASPSRSVPPSSPPETWDIYATARFSVADSEWAVFPRSMTWSKP